MSTRIGRRVGAVAVVGIAVSVALIGSAGAGVVGSGTPDSCTEDAFATQLAAGGTVTFDCGGPATIAITGLFVGDANPKTVVDGGNQITLDGGNANQIIWVGGSAASLPDVTFKNITFANAKYDTGLNAGGAIVNTGNLTLDGVTFVGNSAAGAGGAIFQEACVGCLAPSLTVTGCIFTGNSTGSGGAIDIEGGSFTASDAAFIGNSAASGGAIHFYLNGGQAAINATIRRCTFSANLASFSGGAIAQITGLGDTGSLTVVDSTFSGNTANGADPASAAALDVGAGTTLSSVTVAGNVAPHGVGVALSDTVVVRNSIFANNAPTNCDLGGTLGPGSGHNLQFGDSSCGAFASGDPKLGALADNGGPTQTMLPAPGSAAIDAVPSGSCSEAVDQRGMPRPSPNGGACDAGAVEAQAGDSVASPIWVPVASHVAGKNGSQWRSDLGLLNLNGAAANVRLTAHVGGQLASQTFAVGAGLQSVLVDVLSLLGTGGSGAVEVSSDLPVRVTSRTYNQSAAGTFGQDYAAAAAGQGLGAGDVAWLGQLAENAAYRTNIGVTDTGDGPASVAVDLYDGAGNHLGSYPVDLLPGEWQQQTQPFFNVGGQIRMDRGYAKLTVISGSGVVASASLIDNTTNDPTTLNPAVAGPQTTMWVPVASHAPGLNGSLWRSDLGLLNPGAAPAHVHVKGRFAGGAAALDAAVAPGAQVVVADVVSQLRANGSGALEVVSDQPLVVTARTYNQSPAGTYGQDYLATSAGGGLAAGESGWLPHLAESASYRTNIGLANTGPAPATAMVELYDVAGQLLASYTVDLQPGEWRQETQPFRNLAGQTAMARGYAKVTVTSGSGVTAVASLIDQTTNDPTTINVRR